MTLLPDCFDTEVQYCICIDWGWERWKFIHAGIGGATRVYFAICSPLLTGLPQHSMTQLHTHPTSMEAGHMTQIDGANLLFRAVG